MPKFRVLSAGEVCRILQQNGFHKARQSGSHIVMKKPMPEGERVAIVPNHREIRQGTLKSIIDQSGLNRELFLA
jgi:predicted RNA binding protein YcfA (HicA-like mRNA interferase family)